MRSLAGFSIFSAICLNAGILAAQDKPSADSLPKKAKRVRLYPLPTISYAPETQWAFGAVLQSTIQFFQDSATRYSTAKAEATFTTRSQIIATLEWQLSSRKNRFLILGKNAFLKFPELFWGIGQRPKDREGELFEANRIELYNEADHQFAPFWYAGALQRLQKIYNLKTADTGYFVQDQVTGRHGGISSGLGFSFFRDSRDRLLNPSQGTSLLAWRQTFFQKVFGSEFIWNQAELDGRHYSRFFWPNWTLAIQTYHLMQFGSPPFRMMALMGSDVHMRGYYQGSFRDRNYHTIQAEVRYPIYRWLRGVAFVGLGDVADKPFELHSFPKTSIGAGLRVLVDKKEATYMRFDFGYGSPRNMGFYIGFGEAF